MVRCPRCDDDVDALYDLPADLGREAVEGASAVCRLCRNEIREG